MSEHRTIEQRSHRGIGEGFCTDTDCWCHDPSQNRDHPYWKREQVTSNSIVQRLRDNVTDEYKHTDAAMMDAADEIERLTAEQHGLTRAQIESLQIDYGAHVKALDMVSAERDRLRAALEEIGGMVIYEWQAAHRMQVIARKTLAGSHSHPSSESAGGDSHKDRPKDRPADAQETVEVRRGAWVFVRTKWDTGRATVTVSGADFLVTHGEETR